MKTKVFSIPKLAMLAILIILLGFTSCQKMGENPPNDEIVDFSDLTVNPSFKFISNQKITANFSVTPYFIDEAPHIFKIYQGNPERGGKLLTQGMTDNVYSYSVVFTLANRLDSIYVENSNANGIYEIIPIAVSSNTINRNFNSSPSLKGNASTEKAVYVDPGCGNDCDESIAGTFTDLELDKNDFCVPEGSSLIVNGQLKFKRNATLVICGNATINDIASISDRGKIYVSKTGSLSFPENLLMTSKVDILNWGTYTAHGNLTTYTTGYFYNYGTANIIGNLTNNTNQFQNEGTLNINGNFISTFTNKGKNYGTMNVTGNAMFNSNTIFYNYCKMVVDVDLILDKHLRNYAYIEVGGTFTINTSGQYLSYNGALTKTRNLICKGKIQASGTGYSKIEITNNTTFNTGSQIVNRMDICDANGIETNHANVSSKVVYCETTIPESACNPGSGGNTGIIDTDSDGVPDVDDQYPEDANRAFDNYYPNQEDFSSFAYEDLWPGLGDYDFNDLVLDFQYKIVTNAENKIVDIIATTHVRAAGATLNNGFGIAFPTAPSNCESATGYRHLLSNLNINVKGYENGHTEETVVIFYDAINSIYNSTITNTDPAKAFIETDTVTVTTTFSNPLMTMGQEPYNPFIFVDQERGKEIHFIDKAPTALVNSSYYGTLSDNSNPEFGRYYVTANNLPWAIEIPVSFDYPIEKADILLTYLKFQGWATSSGLNLNDWYLDKPGYRNVNNIYNVE